MINPKKSLERIPLYQLPAVTRQNKIRLDLNENSWGCSPKVIEAIKNIDPKDVAVYPEYEELTGKIADSINVRSENVLMTSGGDDAIRCVMATYIEKDDEVIIPVPAFSEFEIHAKLNEAKIVEVVYNEDLSFPLDKLLNAITQKTKVIVIINPNNPTGTSLEKEDFIRILEKARNAMVFLDEAYCHFSKVSWVDLIHDFDNLIIMHTFSKVFGLAGVRLGYMISDDRNISQLKKVDLPYSVNSVALIAGNAALDDVQFIRNVVKEMEVEKEFLYRELKQFSKEVFITDTNFILVSFGKSNDTIHEKLMDSGILIRNLKNQPIMQKYLRITIGTHEENLVLLKTLKEIIAATNEKV